MKNKLIYLLVLLLTLFIAIISPYEFPVFLLAFEILLLAGLLCLSWYLSRKVEISLEMPVMAVSKQEPVPVEIKITNYSKLPIANVAVEFCYIDGFDGTQFCERTSGMVDSDSTVVLRLKITARYAGKISFRLDRAIIYDYLKLFGWPVPVKEDCVQVLVVPDVYRVQLDAENMSLHFMEEGDSHSHDKSGDDVSEVFDTRAYRLGDTLQRVHWKLSAKTGEVLVKEFSMPVENMVLLLVDLYLPKTQEWNHLQMDGMLTLIASISYSLLMQGCAHEVAWYVDEQGEMQSLTITSEDDIYEMTGLLVDAGVYEKKCNLEELFSESHSLSSNGRILRVDTGWNLYLEGERVASLSQKEMDKALKGLLIGI